ncbi:hypothetical protein BH11PLA1_BH11PLA1_09120 [soil metagenome]
MHPAWRLATNSLSRRRSRTALLVASVALCTALIVAVACAMSSLGRAVERRIAETVGAADARVDRRGGANTNFSTDLLSVIDKWPEVRVAVPRLERVADVVLLPPGVEAGTFRPTGRAGKRDEHIAVGKALRITVVGADPTREEEIRPATLVSGRSLKAGDDGAIVLEENLAKKLGATVGQRVAIIAEQQPFGFEVVGIAQQPGLSAVFDRLNAYVTLARAGALQAPGDVLSSVDLLLKKGTDAEKFAPVAETRLDKAGGMTVSASSKVSAGFEQQAKSNEIGFMLASVLAFLAAAFIVTTGLTTSVTERTRELSVVRCVGGTKQQLAVAQVFVGAIVGFLGGVVGLPAGVAGAALLVTIFKSQLPGGFAMSWLGAGLGLVGAMVAGVIGGLWPAVSAARVSPLEGLSVRARPVHPKWLWISVLAGIALLGVHISIVTLFKNTGATFWLYVFIGAPCLMGGYFLLSAPVTRVVAAVAAGPVRVLLGLPPRMLRRTLDATPYRHGYTAGAMMLGLALMVSIWTNGRAVLGDWLNQLEIPDAFAVGLFPKPESTLEEIRKVPGVKTATPISLLPVALPDELAQGVAGITTFQTSFIGFEPDAFFQMTKLKWESPTDPAAIERAVARLKQGGAVLVSREFLVNRDLAPGQSVTLKAGEKSAQFEIVGVVRSPGLDVVSKFYKTGDQMGDQAMNSVFGTRADLKEKFNFSAWNLIQIAFTDEVKANANLPVAAGAAAPEPEAPAPKPAPEAAKTAGGMLKGLLGGAAPAPTAASLPVSTGPRTPDAVLADVKQLLGIGVLEVGSALEIKARIADFIGGTMVVASVVAIGAMLVACFAVANLIVAGIQARQFEFGVLRAVGAQRGLLGRLVIGEAIVIGLSACILGTFMGMQGGWGGQKLYQIILGIVLTLRPPWGAIGWGSLAVVVITVAASLPAALRLVGKAPRELLGAMKG